MCCSLFSTGMTAVADVCFGSLILKDQLLNVGFEGFTNPLTALGVVQLVNVDLLIAGEMEELGLSPAAGCKTPPLSASDPKPCSGI